MLQRSQEPALVFETIQRIVVGCPRARDLDGDVLLERAIGSSRQVDAAHPACPENSLNPVRAERGANQIVA